MSRYPGQVARLDGAAQEKKKRVDVILEKAAALARARMGPGVEVERGLAAGLLAGDVRLSLPKPPPVPAGLVRQPAPAQPAAGPAAGPAGPVAPSKKNKKEKKKEKKEKKKDKEKEREKERGQKSKGAKSGKKKRKKSSASESTSSAAPEDSPEHVEDAPEAPSATCYKGHFLHPAFGSRQIDTLVKLQSAAVGSWGEATGHWVIMGEVVDSKVTATYEGKRVSFSDGTIVLEGSVHANGVVRGEVVMGGVRGGSFELTPSEPIADAVNLASPSPNSDASPQFAEPVGGAESSDDSDALVVMDEVSRPIAPPPQPSGQAGKAVLKPPAKAGSGAAPSQDSGRGRGQGSPPAAAKAAAASPPALPPQGEPPLRPGNGRPMCIKSKPAAKPMTRSKAKSKAGVRELGQPEPEARSGSPAKKEQAAKSGSPAEAAETRPPAKAPRKAELVAARSGSPAKKDKGGAKPGSSPAKAAEARTPAKAKAARPASSPSRASSSSSSSDG